MLRVQADSQMNCTSLVLNDGIPMMIEPILLDSNGDNIADLFGVNVNQTKGNYSWDIKSKVESRPVYNGIQNRWKKDIVPYFSNWAKNTF